MKQENWGSERKCRICPGYEKLDPIFLSREDHICVTQNAFQGLPLLRTIGTFHLLILHFAKKISLILKNYVCLEMELVAKDVISNDICGGLWLWSPALFEHCWLWPPTPRCPDPLEISSSSSALPGVVRKKFSESFFFPWIALSHILLIDGPLFLFWQSSDKCFPI